MLLLSPVCLVACKGRHEPVDYVDPFIGTGAHGHTYPGATTPYGAVQLSPDTRRGNWDACSGYHYSDSSIIGFSHTHLSGTGCIDFGDILFHPTTKEPVPVPEGYIFEPLRFSHSDESASPGYYGVRFREEGIEAELTATTRAGVHRYTFEKGRPVIVIIDMAHLLDGETIDTVALVRTAVNEISGMRRTQGWTPNQYVHFTARFSKEPESVEWISGGRVTDAPRAALRGNLQAVLRFGISDGTPLVAKVGLSIVSHENARDNLDREIAPGDYDFDAIRLRTREMWREYLSDIVVEGASEREMRNFYTARYHAGIVPNIVNDANGEYRRHDMGTGKLPEGGRRYSTLSLWDTFRAWHPMITLTDHDMVRDIVASFMDMYAAGEGGELPLWPLSAGETGTMIGYHAVSVITDAYLKGILEGFDGEALLEAMKRSSNINKKGSDYYVEHGFIPSNIKKESVSCALEYAYDDWCIARMAEALGRSDDCEEYSRRAMNYMKIFDGNTMFFRGKRLDGNWEPEFNTFAPDRAFTEATPWQYRFFVPHDIFGLMQQFGGRAQFEQAVDDLFSAEERIDGTMSDITGLIGQYAHGNEPSHHMAYLYNYTGSPWKTQAMTRRLLDEMYSPDPEGISGNEDCGAMSAWYVMSALGLYPVCPGSGEFNLTTPLFRKATIRLAGGGTLTIKADSPRRNRYISRVVMNGRPVETNFITYAEIMRGGELKFELSPEPCRERGSRAEDSPYSQTRLASAAIPHTPRQMYLFTGSPEVSLDTRTPGAQIRYTLDGSETDENSTLYEGPFAVSSDCTIRARAFHPDYAPSEEFVLEAVAARFSKPVAAAKKTGGVRYSYYEGTVSSVAGIEKTRLAGSGTMAEPSIENAAAEDHFSFIFSGVIDIPQTGIYEFAITSDDGSRLTIDGIVTVDNDGSHSAITATGLAALEKGCHSFELRYFEDYEGNSFEWRWKKPGATGFEPVPAGILFANTDLNTL